MNDPATLLMLGGVFRRCPDCQGDRIFLPADGGPGESGEICCTACGAALLVDPACPEPMVRNQPGAGLRAGAA
ncbi:MAG TPA: hypothetical protein VFI30_00670 [Nocardioidaceae bacterium]|nr:hypothetical protein [Nocardioidaceae bacterium]